MKWGVQRLQETTGFLAGNLGLGINLAGSDRGLLWGAYRDPRSTSVLIVIFYIAPSVLLWWSQGTVEDPSLTGPGGVNRRGPL